MRTRFLVGPLLLLLVGGCSVADRVGPKALQRAGNPAGSLNDPSGIDIGGGRLPDLIVDGDATAKQWVVRDEQLDATLCSVEEGGVTPGVRRILRMTVMTPNIGTADNFIGNPLDHVGPMAPDGSFPQSDGLFEFAPCHNHFHFKHYALYELVDAHTGFVWKAAKKGFCMLDTDPNPTSEGVEPPGPKNYSLCGTKTSPGFQGISHGWTDTYRFFLGGQYFVLDGGDGQPAVPPGDYLIRITVNPPYAPTNGVCPRGANTMDSQGMCHQFQELRYDNNVAVVPVTIPDHVGKTGFGPAAGLAQPAGEPVDGNTK